MLELFHVGLTVKDLERSLAFYRDIAGMTPGEIFHGASPEFDTLTNNPGARLRGVHLTAGPFMIQLLQYGARGGIALDLHHNNVGSSHFCFYVPDAEAKNADLRQRGNLKITSEIVQVATTCAASIPKIPTAYRWNSFKVRHDAASIRDAQLFGFTLDGTKLLSLTFAARAVWTTRKSSLISISIESDSFVIVVDGAISWQDTLNLLAQAGFTASHEN